VILAGGCKNKRIRKCLAKALMINVSLKAGMPSIIIEFAGPKGQNGYEDTKIAKKRVIGENVGE
jgi:hypothetical protein